MKRDISLIRLSRDHQRALALSKRIDDVLSGKDDVSPDQLMQETLDMWETGLMPHFRAECECLLARLARQLGAEHALITRTQHDHVSIHALATTIRETHDEATRRSALEDLATLLREHIRWEETALFEEAQELLESELPHLGEDLAARLPEVPPAPSWY
jgi:hemerythrin-like domain-containing protein